MENGGSGPFTVFSSYLPARHTQTPIVNSVTGFCLREGGGGAESLEKRSCITALMGLLSVSTWPDSPISTKSSYHAPQQKEDSAVKQHGTQIQW